MAINFPASPTVNDTFENNGVIYTWNGTSWASGQPFRKTKVNIATTAGVTSYSANYMPGSLTVYLNGVRLIETDDYVASDGTTVVLTEAPVTGDILSLESLETWNITTGEVNGDFNVTGTLTQNNAKVSTVALATALAVGLS